MSAEFDDKGTLLESEVTIKSSELPASILQYIKEHYKGASIKEAAKITKSNGDINYEAEVNKMEGVFDAIHPIFNRVYHLIANYLMR